MISSLSKRFLLNREKFLLSQIRYFCASVSNNGSNSADPVILGIESSCDDSGAAVVNGTGNILGQSLFSQIKSSVKLGGVIHILSLKMHKQNLEVCVNNALKDANMNMSDITAVAVSVKPGNKGNLRHGCKLAKKLCRAHNKPLIPIHHMEAHALTIRMIKYVPFPFMALLASGGHCILAMANDLNNWEVIMDCPTEAPGCSLDHIARRLKLKNLKEFEEICGGKAIEMLAKDGDPYKYIFHKGSYQQSLFKLAQRPKYNFESIKGGVIAEILNTEKEENVIGAKLISNYKDICASTQRSITRYLTDKTQKALHFLDYLEKVPIENKNLVMSGGVACNKYMQSALERMCEIEGYNFYAPPPHLCTDNGIMVAWSGVEYWKRQINILTNPCDYADLITESESPLGPYFETTEWRFASKPAYIKL